MHRADRQRQADVAGELEWRRRKAGQRVQREADHLLERILGLAGKPLVTVIGERHLPEPDPGDHAADEARLFGQGEQRVERAAAHQPKISGVERDIDIRRPRQQPVEAMRRRPLERGFAGPALADAIDHVGVLALHRLQHCRKQFGRVLKIGVDDQDPLAAADVEAGSQRQLMTVVAGQIDRNDVRVRGRQVTHHRP